MNDIICQAISSKSLLMFGYGERVPVVEPHIYGINTVGHGVLSAWVRAGHSRSDPAGGWRTYLVDQMQRVQLLDEHFEQPRAGYNPNDERMLRVFCQLAPQFNAPDREA